MSNLADSNGGPSTPSPKRRYTMSDKAVAARQANAEESTGPRSVAGKLVSRLNASTHGLTAFKVGVVIPKAEVPAYRKLERALLRRYEPIDTIGEWAVRQLIEAFWRSRLIALAEAMLITSAGAFLTVDGRMELIFRYTAMNDRRILMLRQLITEHCRTAVEERDDAKS
jgi:hypothetical protein